MNASSDPLETLADEYERMFNIRPPIRLIGPSDEFIAQTIRDAIRAGEPIAPDFDWYGWLPPGAVA